MFSRLLRFIGMTTALACIPAASAFAFYSPFMPLSCPNKAPAERFEAVVQPIQVTVGNRIYLTTNGPIQNGALVGFIDRGDPTQSQLAVSFPSAIAGTWAYYINSGGGFWATNSRNEAYSLGVIKGRDIRNPALPFGREANRSFIYWSDYNFNGFLFYGASEVTLTRGMPPVGTQVMDTNAKRMIAAALTNGEPFDFGAMLVFYGSLVNPVQWEHTICGTGFPNAYMLHLLHIQPSRFAVEVEPITGTAEVTQSNIVYRVPDACVSKGDRMECPIRTRVNTVPGGFTLKLSGVDPAKAWLLVDGQKTDSVDISKLGSTTLVATGAHLSDLLGTQDAVSLDALALTIVPNEMPQLTAPLNLFSNAQLKRLTFSVAINERDTSALGRYSGSIGQDPDITIPLTIRQFGASKATKVSVNVVAATIDHPNGVLCKFVGNQGTTKVGIPANVRFYSGNEFIDRRDNCSGITHDITTMKWREALGGEFPYMGSLDMDLVFPLSPADLNLDISGKAWLGTVEATGEVRVSAEWK